MPDYNLIELQDSTPGKRHIISAEELMYNFRMLEKKAGTDLYTTLIESTGAIYNPLLTDQLAKAVVQYVLGAYVFDVALSSTNHYVLTPKTGYYTPNTYTDGMKVTFYNTITNTAASYIKITGLDEYEIKYNNVSLSSGDLPANTYITLIYRTSIDADTGQSVTYFDLGTSGNTTSVIENIDNIIQTVVTAAGFTYNQKNPTQLLNSIAEYVYGTLLQVDTTNTSGSTYYLYTLPRLSSTQEYTKTTPIALDYGQIYSFIPHVDNTSPTVTITINNSSTLSARLLDFDGSALKIGQLKKDTLTTFYVDKTLSDTGTVLSVYFKLCSGNLPFLRINNQYINDISSDSNLTNPSNTQLITAKAVKDYVTVSTAKIEPNSIAQSSVDAQGNARILSQLGDSSLEVLTTTDNFRNVEKTTISFDNNTPSVLASSTASGASDPITVLNVLTSGDSTWETAITGYALDGWPRKVVETIAGDVSSRVVIIPDDAVRTTAGQYLLFNGLTEKVDRIKIQHRTDFDVEIPIPSKIKLFITLGGQEYPMCNNINGAVNYDYMTVPAPDDLGIITLVVPSYYDDNNTPVPINIASSATGYTLKVAIEDFSNAQVYPAGYLADIADITTYNPVTDTDSSITKYPWAVTSIELLTYDDTLKTVIPTFYDNTTYEFTNNITTSIASVLDDGTVISQKKPGTYYAVLSIAGNGNLALVQPSSYFVGVTDPFIHNNYGGTSQSFYGGKLDTYWVDTSTGTSVMKVANNPVEVNVVKQPDDSYTFVFNNITYTVPPAEASLITYDATGENLFYIHPVVESSVIVPHIYIPTINPEVDGYIEDVDFYMNPFTEDSITKFISVGNVVLVKDSIGTAPYLRTKIDSVMSYNSGYERELTATYTAVPNVYYSITLNHNFGANVTTRVLLECIDTDNTVEPGTCYELPPYTNTTEDSLFLISSNKYSIILGYKNLGFYDTTGTWFTPTAGKWQFVVEVNKRLN